MTLEVGNDMLYELWGKDRSVTGKPILEALPEIKDQGLLELLQGIYETGEPKIFHTFTRLNSKDKYEGTGLGLALCRKIVQRHGGRIEASGKKEQGAVFIITLPLSSFK